MSEEIYMSEMITVDTGVTPPVILATNPDPANRRYVQMTKARFDLIGKPYEDDAEFIQTENFAIDPSTGLPVVPVGMVKIRGLTQENFAEIAQDRIKTQKLPTVSRGVKMNAIAKAEKAGLRGFMRRYNIIEDTDFDGPDSFREVIQRIGERIDPAFKEERFDFSE